MKSAIKIIIYLTALFMIIGGSAYAQKKSKVETIHILTTAICEECKERIETALAYEKGIVKSYLDVQTKKIMVKYNPAKTTPDKIRQAISKTGYGADDVPADKEAYAKLPACCRMGGMH